MATASKAPFTAGWLFWLAVFAVFFPVIGYLSWIYRTPDAAWFTVMGFAAIVSAVSSGIVTWLINSAFQWHDKRQKLKTRKKKGRKKR